MSPRTGPRRRPIQARVGDDIHRAVEQRAAAETEGSVSEWMRRALTYATNHMPRGWRPDEEASET